LFSGCFEISFLKEKNNNQVKSCTFQKWHRLFEKAFSLMSVSPSSRGKVGDELI
jgi:hypothetical protein